MLNFGKQYLSGKATELEAWLDGYSAYSKKQIDATYQHVIATITTEFNKLGDLMKSAFDESQNTTLRLQASINLARDYGVAEDEIIHITDELDEFMLA